MIRTAPFRRLIGCGDDEAVVALIMVGSQSGGVRGEGETMPQKLRLPRRRRELLGDVLRDL